MITPLRSYGLCCNAEKRMKEPEQKESTSLHPSTKKVLKIAECTIMCSGWSSECRLDIYLGDKYIQISIIFSGCVLDSSADIDTCLFQLLVGIPVPHVLVFVICVRIALPEKTNTVRRDPECRIKLTGGLYSQRSSSWVVIWASAEDVWGGGGQAERKQSVTAGHDGQEHYMLPHPTCPSCERYHDHTEHRLTHARLLHRWTWIQSFTRNPRNKGREPHSHYTLNLLSLTAFPSCCH